MVGSKPYRDKDRLERLYHRENMSLKEIGEELDCCAKTVHRWMKKLEIPRRDNTPDGFGDYERKGPVHLRTNNSGYEQWATKDGVGQKTLVVHRLLAVSEFGIDEVKGKVVHHKKNIPWLNTPDNLELMENGEHVSYHMSQRTDYMIFADDGKIAGWSK